MQLPSNLDQLQSPRLGLDLWSPTWSQKARNNFIRLLESFGESTPYSMPESEWHLRECDVAEEVDEEAQVQWMVVKKEQQSRGEWLDLQWQY